ncbi:hypothetical protein SRHO_G00113530 [Serrasalmus rhombeus]
MKIISNIKEIRPKKVPEGNLSASQTTRSQTFSRPVGEIKRTELKDLLHPMSSDWRSPALSRRGLLHIKPGTSHNKYGLVSHV